MPRAKVVVGKKEGGRDPVYAQARWGTSGGGGAVRKPDPVELVPVRSGGRIKKAKTIFDPSDNALTTPKAPVPPPPAPPQQLLTSEALQEKRVQSRRFSVSTSATTMSAFSNNGSAPSPALPVATTSSAPSSSGGGGGGGAKKRKVDIPAASSSRPSITITKVPGPAPTTSSSPRILPHPPSSPGGMMVPKIAIQIAQRKVVVPVSPGGKSQFSLVRARTQITTTPPATNGTTSDTTGGSSSRRSTVDSRATTPQNPRSSTTPSPSPSLKRKVVALQCCECNRFDAPDNAGGWLKCSDCMANAHKGCVRVPPTETFTCRKCIVCHQCEEPVSVRAEVRCAKCSVVYHLDCLGPGQRPPERSGATDWLCVVCRPREKATGGSSRRRKAEMEVAVPVAVAPAPAPVVVPVPPEPKVAATATGRGKRGEGEGKAKTKAKATAATKPSINALYNFGEGAENVPDASAWSAQDVYEYFWERFPQEAEVFLEQEIDGVSLLLMRRPDVIQGLGFKLGPALRIFRAILALQARDTDPTLAWY